jgi:hypothetical protein
MGKEGEILLMASREDSHLPLQRSNSSCVDVILDL